MMWLWSSYPSSSPVVASKSLKGVQGVVTWAICVFHHWLIAWWPACLQGWQGLLNVFSLDFGTHGSADSVDQSTDCTLSDPIVPQRRSTERLARLILAKSGPHPLLSVETQTGPHLIIPNRTNLTAPLGGNTPLEAHSRATLMEEIRSVQSPA